MSWGIKGIYESDGSGFGHTDYFDNILDDLNDALKDAWNEVARPIVDKVFNLLGFEDQDIYGVQVATSQLLSDETYPLNSVTLAVITAIRNNGNIPTHLQRALLTNPVNSLNLYMQYGKNIYLHALPSIVIGHTQTNDNAVDVIISSASFENQAITIQSLSIGFPGAVHWVKQYLQTNESYTQDDNIITYAGNPWIYNGFTIDGNGKFDVQLTRIVETTGNQTLDYLDNGSHDGAANAAVLTDTSKSWTVGEWVGGNIVNSTDGSSGTITANTATTITAVLSGGTENDWDVSDAYSISVNAQSESILTDTTASWTTNAFVGDNLVNDTDGSSGTITANTATTITATLVGGTDNDWDYNDSYIVETTEDTSIGYLINPPTDSAHYYVEYTIDATPTYNKFWTYLISDGTYPTLALISETAVYGSSDMLPIVPIREDSININSTGPVPPAYATSKELLNIINLDIDSIVDSVDDIAANTNAASVTDAFIVFGINLYTSTQIGQKALYLLFDDLFQDALVDKTTFEANPASSDPLFNSVRIEEQNFNSVIVFSYIEETFGLTNFGDPGDYETELDIQANSTVIETEDDTTGIITTTGGGVNSSFIIRYQVANNFYRQLKVFGLFQITSIKTGDGKFKAQIIELTADTNAQRDFLVLIPHYLIIDATFNKQQDRELLVYETMHTVIYASNHVHLQYYETSAFLTTFNFVLKLVGLISIVYDWSGSTAQFLWGVARLILIQYALTLVLNELLYIFGDSELARLLIYVGYIAASVYIQTGKTYELLSAETFLLATNTTTQLINREVGIEADELQQEQEAWLVSRDERLEEIEKAQSTLDSSTGLSLEEMVAYLPTTVYENPTNFYERVIHNGNPGILALSQIENYHDNLLQLPELDVHSFDPISPYG